MITTQMPYVIDEETDEEILITIHFEWEEDALYPDVYYVTFGGGVCVTDLAPEVEQECIKYLMETKGKA
jgi:hypothetical protein